MSTERDVTPIVRSWLEIGPTALPDRVLDVVLDRLPATPQRRPRWRTRRLSLMSCPIRIGAAAAAIGLFAVIGINVLPRGGDVIGTTVDASPTPVPSPVTSPVAPVSLQPPTDVDAYVTLAYEGLVDLPPLAVTIVEQEGTKARYMYDGAGLVHHDHFSNATNSEPSEFRIFSRDVMAERSELDGQPIWLQNTGQGHPLRELAGSAGLRTYCETAWEYAGLDYLIDRPTHHVACGDSEMWLDVQTRLPLRSIRVQGGDMPPIRFDVTELQVGPQPAALFQPPGGIPVMTNREYQCESRSGMPVTGPRADPAPPHHAGPGSKRTRGAARPRSVRRGGPCRVHHAHRHGDGGR